MPPITARFQLAYNKFSLDVDLQLPSTGITILFGQSGSGKTTLLRCIAGLEQAPIGFLEINGTIWQDSENKVFLPTYQRNLGYVFQEANLFPHLSVEDNLQFGLKRLDKRPNKADLKNLLELLGIEHLLKRKPDRLSGGEKQRVAIARALALNPDILLMDEPFSAVDPPTRAQLLNDLSNLLTRNRRTTIFVTHNLKEAAQVGDRVAVIINGQLKQVGTPKQIKESPADQSVMKFLKEL